jgi:membrane-associated protease RseP (regulator of RpoE activity)
MYVVPILLALAAMVACQMATAVYVFAQAALGWLWRIQVQEIAVGYGPSVWRGKIGACAWRLNVLPLGGFTRFKGEHDEAEQLSDDVASRRFQDASPLCRLAILFVGPISSLLLGFMLLGVPVWFDEDQLAVVPAEESQVRPCAVPGLVFHGRASTWFGQWQLFRETALEFVARLASFSSLAGWGGILGFFITCGAVGTMSAWGWVSCVGVALVLLGLINLAPVPSMNGFHVLMVFYEAIAGKPVPQPAHAALTYIGLLLMLVLAVRVVWIDVRWLWGVIFG